MLSLFGNKASIREKQNLLDRLLRSKSSNTKTFQNRHGMGYSKPVSPKVHPIANLADIVGPSLFYFLDVMELDASFLAEPFLR